MYIVLVYDVSQAENGARRWSRIFKICKKYLSHYQLSIFRGPITPSKLILLKKELKKVIDLEEDFISIIKLQSENVFEEELLGMVKEENADNLIV